MVHRLLIVDDDEILRNGIEKNINWKAEEIQVVGTARNGRECLGMIQDCLPHIILTDIKMPFMDGMQLAEAIYNLYPNIKIVLLTAYDDFAYVKKALSYKVTEYVMKYEDNDAILAAVKKAAKEYDRRKNDIDMMQRSAQLLNNKFLNDLVTKVQPEAIMRSQAKQLAIYFFETGYQMICFEIKSKSGNAVSWQAEQLREQCGNLIADCLKNKSQKGYCFTANDHLNVLISGREANDAVELLPVMNAVEESLHVSLIAGVGRYYDDYDGILKSYNEAVQALSEYDFMDGNNYKQKIIYYAKRSNTGNPYANIIKVVKNYIDKNFGNEKLSLNMIAEEVHLTPSYISTIFKKYCKKNIVDYMIEVRITHAKDLLEKTDLKSYEISDRIGYTNSQYFSVLFKKNTGISPMEYRQKYNSVQEKE